MPGDTPILTAISPGILKFPLEFCLNFRVMCIAFGDIFLV